MVNGFLRMLRGVGGRAPDPGNLANGPAPAAPQVGNYQWIQPYLTHLRFTTTNNLPVPPEFQDMATYGVNGYGLSGLTGGGITGQVPQNQNVNSLFFDPATGLYVNIGGGQHG